MSPSEPRFLISLRSRCAGLIFDGILAARSANSEADTGEQEAEVDRLVYGLTDGEVGAVEGR